MYRQILPLKDSTIYDRFPDRNTGVDQILELTKLTSGQTFDSNTGLEEYDSNYTSRILIKFDTTEFQSIVNSGLYKNFKWYLNLYPTEVLSIPEECNIITNPINADWRNGNGNYNDRPSISNGVTWKYRTSLNVNDPWSSSEAFLNTNVTGGGSWYSSSLYEVGSTFKLDSPRFKIDVSNILTGYMSGSIDNHGFLIRYSSEIESDDTMVSSIKIYSKETHTIYSPSLVMFYEPINTYTGSYSTASIAREDYEIITRYLRSIYSTMDAFKMRLNLRDGSITKTYQSSSKDYTSIKLPNESYFSIIDCATGVPVIDYDDVGTKISMDDYGHFMPVNFNNFMPNRYYKFLYKVIYNGDVQIKDYNHSFKVSK